MQERGTRGAYRKEDRVALPAELQKELVEKAAAKFGNCQELAKHLNIPKSSAHYYRTGRLTMPVSVMERMLDMAGDDNLRRRIRQRGVTKDRTWANEYAVSVYREMRRERLRLPTTSELLQDDELRRKAAAIVSYVLAEGSIWIKRFGWDEAIVNITFADHEEDLYNHFRTLCVDVFGYDIGAPQAPGNGAKAIRGFAYSTFIAQWLEGNGVPVGDKSSTRVRLPKWIMESEDRATIVAALQPWCDGEGSVRRLPWHRPVFSLTQARHTNLDFGVIPFSPSDRRDSRTVSVGDLRHMDIMGVLAVDYIASACRSEIFSDVRVLFRKLGLNPKLRLQCIHLKDDGFWSAFWTIYFSASDTERLVSLGLVTQQRKLSRLND